MNYPFWDVGIGYGVLMAIIAVLHVFISHFAIGGGLYLVVSERAARRSNDTLRLEFLERLSRFFALTTLVAGGLTGVGIWFVIGVLNPAATEVLIRNFVWGWATEWTFFFVEIAAAILYYHGWKRMAAREHMIVGWVYFAAAWLSLFVINGILSFMLTPGRWLATGEFWDGFFNETFWPSLVLRTGVCIMLAGMYALLLASFRRPDAFRKRLIRLNALWGAGGLAIVASSSYWYWKAIPETITAAAVQRMPLAMFSAYSSFWLAGAIALVLVVFGLLLPARHHVSVAVLGMALSLGWFGSFEWFREAVRKPFIITGYMYGSSLEVARSDAYRTSGLLTQISYRTGDDGADLLRRMCRSCHTIGGYLPLRRPFDGMDQAFIAAATRMTGRLKGNMPPFPGNAQDAELLAAHLYGRVDHRPMGEIYGLEGTALGALVYGKRCAVCHPMGTDNDKRGQLASLGSDEIHQLLDMSADLGPGMPPFTARAEERKAIIEYLESLGKGGSR